jgi:hypothetical protein
LPNDASDHSGNSNQAGIVFPGVSANWYEYGGAWSKIEIHFIVAMIQE